MAPYIRVDAYSVMQHAGRMVKPSKSFRKQAEKAEAQTDDPEYADRMRTLAEAFHAQADAIKAAEKAGKRGKA